MHREKAAEAGGLIPKQASATMANDRLLPMRIPRSKSSGNHAKLVEKYKGRRRVTLKLLIAPVQLPPA